MNKTMLYRATCALSAVVIVLILASVIAARQPQPSSQNNADELLKKAEELYKAGKFQEAITVYKQVVDLDPNNDQAIGYIAYSFNRLGDKENARQWMKRRVDIPGQSPSRKAVTLTDIALLYWDEAHLSVAARKAGDDAKAADAAAVQKLLNEGLEAANKAVAIAPRSVKGFNLLNLLHRTGAEIESDPAKKKAMTESADQALRQAIQFFEALPAQQQAGELFAAPTISYGEGGDLGPSVKLGQATKKPLPEGIKDNKAPLAVEVIVGRDGKARLHRLVAGQGKAGEAALAAAKQWEFEPTTFEGHPVQLISVIKFSPK